MLWIGDANVIFGDSVPKICIVQTISEGNKDIKSMEAVLETTDDSNRLMWTGRMTGESFVCHTNHFSLITPNLL